MKRDPAAITPPRVACRYSDLPPSDPIKASTSNEAREKSRASRLFRPLCPQRHGSGSLQASSTPVSPLLIMRLPKGAPVTDIVIRDVTSSDKMQGEGQCRELKS